jgi:hypothetical protein
MSSGILWECNGNHKKIISEIFQIMYIYIITILEYIIYGESCGMLYMYKE